MWQRVVGNTRKNELRGFLKLTDEVFLVFGAILAVVGKSAINGKRGLNNTNQAELWL